MTSRSNVITESMLRHHFQIHFRKLAGRFFSAQNWNGRRLTEEMKWMAELWKVIFKWASLMLLPFAGYKTKRPQATSSNENHRRKWLELLLDGIVVDMNTKLICKYTLTHAQTHTDTQQTITHTHAHKRPHTMATDNSSFSDPKINNVRRSLWLSIFHEHNCHSIVQMICSQFSSSRTKSSKNFNRHFSLSHRLLTW